MLKVTSLFIILLVSRGSFGELIDIIRKDKRFKQNKEFTKSRDFKFSVYSHFDSLLTMLFANFKLIAVNNYYLFDYFMLQVKYRES